jgi:hypothetical protein
MVNSGPSAAIAQIYLDFHDKFMTFRM